jgi:hypothetical protein
MPRGGTRVGLDPPFCGNRLSGSHQGRLYTISGRNLHFGFFLFDRHTFLPFIYPYTIFGPPAARQMFIGKRNFQCHVILYEDGQKPVWANKVGVGLGRFRASSEPSPGQASRPAPGPAGGRGAWSFRKARSSSGEAPLGQKAPGRGGRASEREQAAWPGGRP